MNKLKEEILNLKKYKKTLGYLVFIVLFGYFSYFFYLVFNPKPDLVYQAKVMEQINSVDLNFDKKTIEKINLRNITGKEINLVPKGRNPFLTY